MEIRHESESSRFVADLEDGQALLEYTPIGDRTWDLRRTYVPQGQRGRGIASELVRHVLDRAAERQIDVVPSCWFVGTFLEANPEYKKLVAVSES